jgi:hypothetical protein
MRLGIVSFFALCLASVSFADQAAEVAKLEKAGGDVRIDSDMPMGARVRVSFKALDDKTAVALRGATNVGSLVVEDASRLTDRSMAIIGTLTNLRELNLVKPAITNSGIAHLRNLKELQKLYIFEARIYDSGIAYLKDLDQLEELDLTGSGITNAAAATFKSLGELKLLAVGKTKFGDAGAAQLKDMTNLKSLDAEISVKAAMALEAAIPGIKIRR